MPNITSLRTLALSLPETTELPHFEKTSFRVRTKIFATYDASSDRACVKLSAIDQNVFSLIDPSIINPIPNKWGKLGWTFFELERVDQNILIDALQLAYCEVAPKKLASVILSERNNNLKEI